MNIPEIYLGEATTGAGCADWAGLSGRAVGQAEQALELAICVLCHPASTQETKDRAEHLRVELESQLTPQQIEMGQASAKAKSLDELVPELLNLS